MGGNMNLNPLKKDDNTDALVKALEDANNVGAPTNAGDTPVPQPAVDANSPSVGATNDQFQFGAQDPVAPSTPDESTPRADTPSASPTQSPQVDLTVPAPDATEDTPSSTSTISFDGNDLPGNLSSDANAHISSSSSNDIDDVKKSALEQLRPLIETLDLEPADKFDKYLMMLRASDDQTLIKPAFDAAQGITNEKEKAQALLDIINEINYITANQSETEPATES